MSTTEQLDRAVSIAANAAYILVVLSLIVLMFPALRRPAAHLARRILYDYRYGVWVGQQPPRAPVPAWVRQVAKPGVELAVELERPE
jgi:hypothetical protein